MNEQKCLKSLLFKSDFSPGDGERTLEIWRFECTCIKSIKVTLLVVRKGKEKDSHMHVYTHPFVGVHDKVATECLL